MSIFPKKYAADLAKTLTAMCVRNTMLENIHAGKYPLTKTGDFSDVKVIDAEGNEYSWDQMSRITDNEMKQMMKGTVDRLYTFFMQGDDERFEEAYNFHRQCTANWDEPQITPSLDCRKKHAPKG